MNESAVNAFARTRGRPRIVEREEVHEPIKESPRSTTATAHGRSRKRRNNADRFWVDPAVIPDGWVYQWCRKSVYNMPDTGHMVGLLENGWTEVPSDRHEGLFMPPGHRGSIDRDGLVLMERPVELQKEARADEKRAADNLIRIQKESLGLTLPDGFDGRHRQVQPRVSTSYERGIPQSRHTVID